MGTPLTLERCAEMRAEMEAGRLRDDVLGRAGIDADAWTLAQREWLERMGSELKRSRFELTNRYSQAFLERQRELQALAQPVAEAPPLVAPVAPAPPAPVAPPPALPMAPPSIVGAPPMSTPSPWAADGHRPAVTMPPPTVPLPPAPSPWSDATGAPEPSPLRAALPFHEPAAGAPLPPPAPPPRAPSGPRPPPANPTGHVGGNPQTPGPSIDATVFGAVSPFAAGAELPFARDAAPSPSAPTAASLPRPAAPLPRPGAAPPPRPPAATTTQPLKLAPPPPRPPGPPPQPGVPPAKPAALPLPPRSPRGPASPEATEPQPMATVFDAVSPFAAAPALPFAPARPPPPAPPPPAPPPPAPPPPAPVAARAPGPQNASSTSVSASPAPAHAVAVVPSLTLEQHVSLCAELAYAPTRAAEVLGRYHVTAPMKAELDQQWQARFKADPAVEKKWQEAYRIYFAFLASAQRR